MLENIGNAITRLPMNRLGRNLVVVSHQVPDMMRFPWQRRIKHSAVMETKRVNQL